MFEGGISEVVDSLSIVALIVCFKGAVFGPCFIVQCCAIGTASAHSAKFRGIRPRMYIADLF